MNINYEEVVLRNKILREEMEIKVKKQYLKELQKQYKELVKKNREEGNY